MNICLPSGLERGDIERVERIVEHRYSLQRHDHLYRAGDRFRSLYMVRTGSLKRYALTLAGEEQVLGFHLPGDLFGFDAIDGAAYPSSAVALELTSICEVSFQHLEELCRRLPRLQHQLLRRMSSVISDEETMFQALAKGSAEERLANFVLGFSERSARGGLSRHRLHLSMPRRDLSSYLGLAPETLSRLCKCFRERGWTTDRGKELVIEDFAALQQAAGLARSPRSPVRLPADRHFSA